MQGQIPSLLLILILVFWFNVARVRIAKRGQNKNTDFWEKEQKANQTRKQSLDSLDYIDLPMEQFPFMETMDEQLKEAQDHIRSLSGKKIVNLTGISNTDLKLKYGASNLDLLTEYDDNFTTLARLLYQWGSRLHQLSYDSQAQKVLELGVKWGTDIKGHYFLLASLYINDGKKSQIQTLITRAAELNSLNKNRIICGLLDLQK